MRFIPRDYQAAAAAEIQRQRDTYLAWDCGVGKTGTVLHALREEDLPALIVAPLRVCKYVWPAEVKKWDKGFSTHVLHKDGDGKDLDDVDDLSIINPAGLLWLFTELKKQRRMPFRTLIVDEATDFKSIHSKRWKHLKALSLHVRKAVLLSGTPAPNGLQDLWAQLDLFSVNPLGEWEEFLEDNFDFDCFGKPTAIAGAAKRIHTKVAPVMNRQQLDELNLPGLTEQVIRFDLSAETRLKYEETDQGLGDASDLDAYTPLRTMASGFTYHQLYDGSREVKLVHGEKLKVMGELLKEIGQSTLVLFNFRQEREDLINLARKLNLSAAFIDGGSTPGQEARALELWESGGLDMLALHPRSAGHGLNLQGGGCHVVCYGPTDSGDLDTQAIGRLYRSGQAKPVVVHRLVAAETIEEPILQMVRRKHATQGDLLRAVAAWRSR